MFLDDVYDRDTIKELAAARGVKVPDLLALAPKNDPFYVGGPAQRRAAEWFAKLWSDLGYAGRTGVHLRRIHYRMVSDVGFVKPDGTAYANTEADWKILSEASKSARYLSLVPTAAFDDRRNPDPIIFSGDGVALEPAVEVTGDDEDPPDAVPYVGLSYLDPLPDLPDFEVSGYEGVRQPYLVEIWAEKTTMNDVLLPLCRRYGVNLITGMGELSVTSVLVYFKRRLELDGRPARIFYVSDFDPAGLGMPVSVARKIEFDLRQSVSDADVRLEPLVLTAEQTRRYRLPRIPIKDKETRKDHFEAIWGEGAVELDALEGAHEGELARLVEEAILRYYDPELQEKADGVRDELASDLDDERQGVIDRRAPALDALDAEYGELRAEYDRLDAALTDLVAPLRPEIDRLNERITDFSERWREARDEVAEALRDVSVDLDDYALPEAALPEEGEDALYDSSRDYLEQIEFYKRHRGEER